MAVEQRHDIPIGNVILVVGPCLLVTTGLVETRQSYEALWTLYFDLLLLPLIYYFACRKRGGLGRRIIQRGDPADPKQSLRNWLGPFLPPIRHRAGIWIVALAMALYPYYMIGFESVLLAAFVSCLCLTEFMHLADGSP